MKGGWSRRSGNEAGRTTYVRSRMSGNETGNTTCLRSRMSGNEVGSDCMHDVEDVWE